MNSVNILPREVLAVYKTLKYKKMLLFLYFCVARIEVPFDRRGNFLHIFCLFPRLFFFLIPSLDPNLESLGRRSCQAQMSSLRVLLASGAPVSAEQMCGVVDVELEGRPPGPGARCRERR